MIFRPSVHKWKLKLYHVKKKPYVNMIQKHRHLLWAKANLRWSEAKWKTVLWSDESQFEIRYGKHGRRVLWTREKRDHPGCYQQTVQQPVYLSLYGVALVPVVWRDYTSGKTPSMLKRTWRF